jgi:hypothetical protein
MDVRVEATMVGLIRMGFGETGTPGGRSQDILAVLHTMPASANAFGQGP